MKIGESIRIIRVSRGITQTALVKAAQANLGYLSDVERGRARPSEGYVLRIAAALNFPYEALINPDLSATELLGIANGKKVMDPPSPAGVLPREHSTSSAILPGVPLVDIDQLLRWDWTTPSALEKTTKQIGHYTEDRDAFAIEATGPELTGEGIPEGSWVVLSLNERIESGGCVLVRTDRGVAIRKYYEHGEIKELRSISSSQRTLQYYPGIKMVRAYVSLKPRPI